MLVQEIEYYEPAEPDLSDFVAYYMQNPEEIDDLYEPQNAICEGQTATYSYTPLYRETQEYVTASETAECELQDGAYECDE